MEKRWNEVLSQTGYGAPEDFLNDLHWNLGVTYQNEKWILWTGELMLYQGKELRDLQVFQEGMAVALAVLPSSIRDEIRRYGAE